MGAEQPEITARSETETVGPLAHAAFWFAIGCAALAVVQLPLALSTRGPIAPATSPSASSAAPSSSIVESTSVSSAMAALAPSTSIAPSATSMVSAADPSEPAATHARVVDLAADASIEIARAKVGKRSCDAALAAMGVPKEEVARVAAAMAPMHRFGACRRDDRVAVAVTKAGHHVKMLELEGVAGDFVFVSESTSDAAAAVDAGAPTSKLAAEKVTLPVSHRRVTASFAIASDLTNAVAAASLDPTTVDELNQAITTRPELSFEKGATVRMVGDASYVGGVFDRWDELVALEVREPSGTVARLYHQAKVAWFDNKGHAPMQGKWRLPLASARVTSRFNPKRMHPVLHTIMPHNGCDFAASTGTAVYSIAGGMIGFVGNSGPSGNLVTVEHDGGYQSGYAHLSRFAPGISPGVKVEVHTLIGYSGSTGRSTGPHLHLSVKKNGVFIDPLSLKLDGTKVVPPSERETFTAKKAEADAALDALPIPNSEVAPVPTTPAPPPTTNGDETPGDDN